MLLEPFKGKQLHPRLWHIWVDGGHARVQAMLRPMGELPFGLEHADSRTPTQAERGVSTS